MSGSRKRETGWMALGLGTMAALIPLYALAPTYAAVPLGSFLIPVLVVATVSSRRTTLAVGAVALLVTLVFSVDHPTLDHWGIASRLVVVCIGTACGVAMIHVRERRDRQYAEASKTAKALTVFERELVPQIVAPPGLSVQTRYKPGSARLHLGGDFLDVVTMEDDTAAFIVGDVSGHGPEEAAFAVGVHAGWRTVTLTEPHSPAGWLAALDVSFFGARPERLATAVCGRIEVSGRALTFASAGHNPPIVVGRDPHVVDVEPDVLLGLGYASTRKEYTVTIGREQGLLVYTDGLTEQHKPHGDGQRWSEDELLTWLSRYDNADAVDLDALLWDFGRGNFQDDVAVMLLHFESAQGIGARRRSATGHSERSASTRSTSPSASSKPASSTTPSTRGFLGGKPLDGLSGRAARRRPHVGREAA